MISGLRPYQKIKDSSVPWLGDVPEHWQSEPLKRWVRINARVLPESTPADFEFRYVDIGTVGTGVLVAQPLRMSFGSAPSRARRLTHAGDTIQSTVRTYLKAVYFIKEEDGDDLVCSTGFAVLSPSDGAVPKFVSYVVQSEPFTNRVSSESVGIAYPAIAESRLGSFRVIVPPRPEQEAIVRFLDHADRRIRRIIRAKQKLIKLLEEQTQAIIQPAVTLGLDRDVSLKSTAISWLGDLPRHWDVRRAKFLYREVDDRSATGHEELLSVSHLTGVTPRSQKNVTMFMASSYVGHKLCQKGDLVINTMWAWMGALGVAKQSGLVSPSYGVYRPVEGAGLLSEYADLLLRTKPFVAEYFRRSTGIQSSRLRLYPEEFLRIQIVCPPVEEQGAIVARVVAETADTQKAISDSERVIALLREYRTRLVADLVTGKVDVREVVAALPEEKADSEGSEGEIETEEEGLERDGEEGDLDLVEIEA